MRFCLFGLLLPILLSCKPLKINIEAPMALLVNADTGAVLYEKNADRSCYPASITKVATAIFILEKKHHLLDEIALVKHDDVKRVLPAIKQAHDTLCPPHRLETDACVINLQIGEKMSLRALLHGLMLCSGDDAGNVLARHISGSVPKFMEELNDYLKQLDLNNTHFNNPHGLHHDNHYSTAYDLVKLARYAMRNSHFNEMVRTIEMPRPKTNLQKASVFKMGNRLIKPGQHFYYSKAVGIKTGYHAKAGYTLISAAEDEHRCLIGVVLKTKNTEQRYKDMIKLFDAAFAEKKSSRTFLNRQFDFFTCDVPHATQSLKAELERDLTLEYFPSEEPTCSLKTEWQPLKLPIRLHQEVGEVHLVDQYGNSLRTVKLHAKYPVEEKWQHRIYSHTFIYLNSPLGRVFLALVGFAVFSLLIYRFAHRTR